MRALFDDIAAVESGMEIFNMVGMTADTLVHFDDWCDFSNDASRTYEGILQFCLS